MISPLLSLALPFIGRLDPERAHRVALLALRAGLGGTASTPDTPILSVEALGCQFSNPIGLAAGFDKDAVAISPLMRLGFGFIEAGTVTLRPQPGNPRPRLFRLRQDRAAINRMGMNGRGLRPFVHQLSRLPVRVGCLGANVGLNKDGAHAERDYPLLVEAVAPFSDYITLNVSSPNTPGLRDLQGEARLRSILQSINAAVPSRPPLLVKIAPDLAEADLLSVVEACVEMGVQGLIVSNTTVSRPSSLSSRFASESGGLSGEPLFRLSTQMLGRVHAMSAGRLTLIGCGGISTGRDILAKIRAGASLVQLYTAFAYEGPTLIDRLKAELVSALHQDGFLKIADAIGVDAPFLAKDGYGNVEP